MEHYYPANRGRHTLTRTYGSKGRNAALLDETFRQSLARDVWDVRKIYQQEGLYGPDVRRALQRWISEWRASSHGSYLQK